MKRNFKNKKMTKSFNFYKNWIKIKLFFSLKEWPVLIPNITARVSVEGCSWHINPSVSMLAIRSQYWHGTQISQNLSFIRRSQDKVVFSFHSDWLRVERKNKRHMKEEIIMKIISFCVMLFISESKSKQISFSVAITKRSVFDIIPGSDFNKDSRGKHNLNYVLKYKVQSCYSLQAL